MSDRAKYHARLDAEGATAGEIVDMIKATELADVATYSDPLETFRVMHTNRARIEALRALLCDSCGELKKNSTRGHACLT